MNLRKPFANPLPPTDYGVEVLCAGWNPVAAGVPEAAARTSEQQGNIPTADAESFLDLFYRLQQT